MNILEVKDTKFGKGCFAKKDFKKGDIVYKGVWAKEDIENTVHAC